MYEKSYTYRDISATQTTNQVAGLVYDLPTDQSFGYTYDNMGNIATYTDANGTVTYTYDALGQLTKAEGSVTYEYSYDNAGNILSANGHTYTYGDATWADLLTAVDGHAITYDAAGNPTSYYNGTNWSFTWEHGRNLGAATNGTTSLEFTYDVDGLRTSKTVNGTKHTYYYAGGTLLRETYGDTVLDFFYAGGVPYAFKHNGTLYYYITNLQGDVMSIVDEQGNVVASYEYDPYGNVISATGDLAETNPLRYRGYYYDAETRLYYLQSRYYDPELGRFINADAYASTGQGVLGYNMFAYCGNNPVVNYDPAGTERISFHYNQFDGHSGSDGGGGGSFVPLWGIAKLLQIGKEAIVKLGSLLALVQVTLTFDPDNGDYFVYVLVDKDKNIQYVGRTKNPSARKSAHKLNPARKKLKFEIVASNLTYCQARGIEQTLMLYCHTLNKSDARNNQINGISLSNDSVDFYIKAAETAFGYTWNHFSNDVLTWLGQ